MTLLTPLFVLVAGLAVILAGAELFTNAVEWTGKRLDLNQGATGSVLAAVGTAMPETLVPLIALLFGRNVSLSREVGVGAILGAPFMLSTLAFFITGLAVVIYARKGRRPRDVLASPVVVRRDLGYFILVYVLVVAAGLIGPGKLRYSLALVLVGLYGLYLWRTFTCGESGAIEDELPPLFFARVIRSAGSRPALGLVLVQVAVALGAIVGGAKTFISGISAVSGLLGVPAFVLSVIITPIATELPEKFNSVIWVSQQKDTLALGNITGAMVFQSSVIPAIGMALTPWKLTGFELATAIIALSSSTAVYIQVRKLGRISPYTLLAGGLFYLAFVVAVVVLR
ncbi:MAG: sodium:calcium antiporter [Firmicutes bacterium]|nr:sodium:calcium antiporter [Bacillota bacterium]